MPPEWMWHLTDELNFHFEEVSRKRKEKYGGGDTEDVPDMWENDLSPRRR